MDRTPEITTLEEIQKRPGYQALQQVQRPPYWGVDRDPARRPGVPMMWPEPKPWPNAKFPPERQPGKSAALKHGRPNRPFPPVFGTSTPLHGLSGVIRRRAYQLPDHSPSHWLLMMLGDRVENAGHRLGKLMRVAVPLGATALVLRALRSR